MVTTQALLAAQAVILRIRKKVSGSGTYPGSAERERVPGGPQSSKPHSRSPKQPNSRLLLLFSALCLLGACDAPPETGPDAVPTVMMAREPLEVDPRFAADVYSLKVSRLLFASLVKIDGATLAPQLDLAESIELRSPTHYWVTLRPRLRFSDGSALDAEDVAATFRGLFGETLGSRYRSTYSRIARIEVHEPLQLSFFLKEPHATFLTDLEMPVLRAEDALRPVGRGDLPVSSGAYVLSGRSRSELRLVRNPHHARRAPFERLRLRVVRDDNIRALRMLTGAGDAVLDGFGPLLLPLFTEKQGFEVKSAPGVGTVYIGINTEAGVLADLRVREALARAIDRRRIVETKLAGRGRLARSFIPPGHWAYDPTTRTYDYDPARARALLEEAGVELPLRLSLRCNSERERMSMARVLIAMLREIGVEVTLRSTETSTLLADLKRGQFELTLMLFPELIEPHVLSWFFGSDHIPSAEVEGANRWRVRDAALDEALERGRSETDLALRKTAYRAVQARLAATLPVVPLWHEDVVAVFGPRMRGLQLPRHGRYDALVHP